MHEHRELMRGKIERRTSLLLLWEKQTKQKEKGDGRRRKRDKRRGDEMSDQHFS